MSPSTISHQVADLETYLGVKLFRRSVRKLELTREGQRYLDDVTAVFERLRLATASIRRDSRPGIVRVSANPFLSSEILIPLVAAFEQAFPGLSIRISTTETLEDPRDGEVDFAIRFGDGRWSGLTVDHLADMSLRPIAAPGVVASQTPRIDYFYRDTTAWTAWATRDLPMASGIPSGERQFTSYAAAMRAVEQGLGVGLGQFPLMNSWLASRRVVLVDKDSKLPVGGLYLASRRLPASQRDLGEVRDWLCKALIQALDG